MAVSRALQDAEEENVEDVDLALRSITYCPDDPRVALQALKMVGIIAFRHPEARPFLMQQAYDEILLAMDNHPDDEFVQGAGIAVMKYLTCGESRGEKASPCVPVASADHYDIECSKLLADHGAKEYIERAMATHPNNSFLQQDGKLVLSNMHYGHALHSALDIDGDGKIEDHELEALAKKLKAKDLDGDGKFSQDEILKALKGHLDVDGDGTMDMEELNKLQNLQKGIDQHGYAADDTVGAGSRAKKKMPGLATTVHDRTGTGGVRIAGAYRGN